MPSRAKRGVIKSPCSVVDLFLPLNVGHATVAQMVEHGTHKPGVAGSIPARGTLHALILLFTDMTWPVVEDWKLRESKEGKKFNKIVKHGTAVPINDTIDDGVFALIGKFICAFQHLENTIISVISRYFGPSSFPSIEAILCEVRFSEILGGLRRLNKVSELCDQNTMEAVCNYAERIGEIRNKLVHSNLVGKSQPDGGVQIMRRKKSPNKYHIQFSRIKPSQLKEFIEETKKIDSFICNSLISSGAEPIHSNKLNGSSDKI